MYCISDREREEIMMLLRQLEGLQDGTIRTTNIKRRAKIALRKLTRDRHYTLKRTTYVQSNTSDNRQGRQAYQELFA